MPRRRRHAAALVVGALSLVACSSGEDDATSTSASSSVSTSAAPTTTPTTTPSTSAAPTTNDPASSTTPNTTAQADTTTPTTDPPTPSTQPGDPDWVEVTQRLADVAHDLQAEPDIGKVDDYCVAGDNPCREILGQQTADFVANGYRVVGVPAPVVIEAILVSTADDAPVDEAIWVEVLSTQAPEDLSAAAVVDQSGEIVFPITSDDPGEPIQSRLVLVQVADGDWRVLGFEAGT